MAHCVRGSITYNYAVNQEPNLNTEKLQKESNESSVQNSLLSGKPLSKEKQLPKDDMEAWLAEGHGRLFF